MKCPVDNATLSMTERSGIEIDYCPECRGVWLDRGELDKLVKGSAEYERDQYQSRDREYRGHDDEDDEYRRRDDRGHYDEDSRHHGKKKRGGFMENIFDGFGD